MKTHNYIVSKVLKGGVRATSALDLTLLFHAEHPFFTTQSHYWDGFVITCLEQRFVQSALDTITTQLSSAVEVQTTVQSVEQYKQWIEHYWLKQNHNVNFNRSEPCN